MVPAVNPTITVQWTNDQRAEWLKLAPPIQHKILPSFLICKGRCNFRPVMAA